MCCTTYIFFTAHHHLSISYVYYSIEETAYYANTLVTALQWCWRVYKLSLTSATHTFDKYLHNGSKKFAQNSKYGTHWHQQATVEKQAFV